MVFRSTPPDCSWSDRQSAWLSEGASTSDLNEHLLTEWLLPKVAWEAQGSGIRLEGTAKPRDRQASQVASMKPMPSEQSVVTPMQAKREEQRTSSEPLKQTRQEQQKPSRERELSDALDIIDPRRYPFEEAREYEIEKIDNEMKEAMEALSDGVALMGQFLGQMADKPAGQVPFGPMRPEMGQTRPQDIIVPPEVMEPAPIWKKVSELFQTLPANTQCTPERYSEVFGEDVAGLLNQMSVQRVSHWTTPDGKHHYSLEFPAKKTHQFKAAEMTHENGIQFEVYAGPDGIRLEEFRGLKVKKTDGTFTATIDRVMIRPEGENVVIEGQGHWFFFKGNKRLVLGPDGKPLPEKNEAKQ